MKFRPTQLQVISLASVGILLLVFSLFPTFGAPHFRYTGSDPSHHVWNLGWPLATCMFDPQSPPYFFVGPLAIPYAIAATVAFSIAYMLLFLWNNLGGSHE